MSGTAYGRIDREAWRGDTFLELDDDARLLAVYLITHPDGITEGLFRCPIETIAMDLRWTFEGASKVLRTLIEAQFCLYDHQRKYVLLVSALKWQTPQGENSCKGAGRALSKLRPTWLRGPLLTQVRTFCPDVERHLEWTEKQIPDRPENIDLENHLRRVSEGGPKPPSPTPSPTPTPSLDSHVLNNSEISQNRKLDDLTAVTQTPTDHAERIWQHYPRKVDKAKAVTQIVRRIKEGTKPEHLEAATLNYADWCEKSKRTTQLILHGATFYGKQGRWNECVDGHPEPIEVDERTAKKQAQKAALDAWEQQANGYDHGGLLSLTDGQGLPLR